MNVSLDSRIRGLSLGLALGDAVGSKASDVPEDGPLEVGVASQLAAWTIEGTLRNITQYGRLNVDQTMPVLRAYRRWAVLRGATPEDPQDRHFFIKSARLIGSKQNRGWLADDPAMGQVRGTSPSTVKALLGKPAAASAGCQALLRVLPLAALGQGGRGYRGGEVEEFARAVALLTHNDGQNQNVSGFAVRMLTEILADEGSLSDTIQGVVAEFNGAVNVDFDRVLAEAEQAPCVPGTLERFAPDRSSWSAFAGGLYVALSFPDENTIAEALEFAGWAPDGDSVGAVAGAILGARHGYEVLPIKWLGRLELGWVMDRLAIDLTTVVNGQQAQASDPRWDVKYPGA